MKKVRLILMVLILSLSVIACGKDTDNESSKSSDKETKSEDAGTDLPDDNDSSKSDDETTEGGVSQEILDAPMYKQVMQIGNTVLNAPFTLQDVLDAGATIRDNKYTPEYLMNVGDEVSVKLAIGDGEVRMYFQNISDTTCSLKDAVGVGGGELGTEIKSSSIYLPGGIHVGSSLSEVQSAWGTADGETVTNESFTYSYYEYEGTYVTGDGYRVTVDRNTAKVKQILLFYTLKLDKIVETVYDYGYSEPSIIIPVPYYAQYVSMLTNYTIETIDGVDYVINYPTQVDLVYLSNVDFSPTEEALNSVLTVAEYVDIKDPIDQTAILKNDEHIGVICAFYNSSETGKYTCRTYMVGREAEHSIFHEASMYALNGETISDNAKQYFTDYMKELMSGCDYITK